MLCVICVGHKGSLGIRVIFDPSLPEGDDRTTWVATWVEEDDGFECRILIFIYLNVLEGLNQLVQHSAGDPGEFRFRTVPVDHIAVACRYTQSEAFNCRGRLRIKGWWNCVVFYQVTFWFQETLRGRSFTSKNAERGRAHMGVSTRQIR